MQCLTPQGHDIAAEESEKRFGWARQSFHPSKLLVRYFNPVVDLRDKAGSPIRPIPPEPDSQRPTSRNGSAE